MEKDSLLKLSSAVVSIFEEDGVTESWCGRGRARVLHTAILWLQELTEVNTIGVSMAFALPAGGVESIQFLRPVVRAWLTTVDRMNDGAFVDEVTAAVVRQRALAVLTMMADVPSFATRAHLMRALVVDDDNGIGWEAWARLVCSQDGAFSFEMLRVFITLTADLAWPLTNERTRWLASKSGCNFAQMFLRQAERAWALDLAPQLVQCVGFTKPPPSGTGPKRRRPLGHRSHGV